MDLLLVQVTIAVAVGYLLGSFPSAYLAGLLTRGEDIRRLGDGNVGAENAYYQLGPRTGIGVGAADIAKGAIVILIIKASGFSHGAVLASGVGAVMGHTWPVFIQFRGGRGAATTLGVLAAVAFPASLIAAVPAAAFLLAKRGTTAAIAGMLVPLPFVSLLTGQPSEIVLFSVGLPLMVGVVHCYQVVLPYYHRTGRLSLRPKE